MDTSSCRSFSEVTVNKEESIITKMAKNWRGCSAELDKRDNSPAQNNDKPLSKQVETIRKEDPMQEPCPKDTEELSVDVNKIRIRKSPQNKKFNTRVNHEASYQRHESQEIMRKTKPTENSNRISSSRLNGIKSMLLVISSIQMMNKTHAIEKVNRIEAHLSSTVNAKKDNSTKLGFQLDVLSKNDA